MKNLNTLQKFFLQMFLVLIVVISILVIGAKQYYENELQKNIELVIEQGEKEIQKEILSFKETNDLNKIRDEIKNYVNEQNFEAIILKTQNEIILEKEINIDNSLIKRIFNKEYFQNYKHTISEIMPDLHNDKVYLFYVGLKDDVFIKILVELDEQQIQLMEDETISYIATIILSSLVIIFFSFIVVYKQFKELIDKEKELLYANVSILSALGNAVSKRDSDTDEHNYRVTYYSVKIAELLDLEKQNIKDLIKGAFLHDVGKIGIEDKILLKPGKLDNDEFEMMKEHVKIGEDIIKDIPWLKNAKKIISYHHEKFNGSGYPHGLKALEIPIEARIFAIVDVFDALTSKRPYKEPFSVEKSLAIIRSESLSHFDPDIVEIFANNIEKFYLEVKDKNKKELEEVLQKILSPYFLK